MGSVQDRRALLLQHQSEVIAGMRQVSNGKLVIILDQAQPPEDHELPGLGQTGAGAGVGDEEG